MSNETTVPFSARNRGPHSQIVDDFPLDARMGLLHVVHRAVAENYVRDWATVASELGRIARVEPCVYSPTYDTDTNPARKDVNDLLFELQWRKVFDFCERLVSHLAVAKYEYYQDEAIERLSVENVQKELSAELQRLFVEENLAYVFENGLVHRRGRRHTVTTVARAEVVLGDPRLKAALQHYIKAQGYFQDPKKPDPENAVKEAVCAVEAAIKVLFPDRSPKTLGDAVTYITGAEEGQLPQAIAKTFHGLYGFRNTGAGVAHGGASGGPATQAIAEYVLAVAASQIILLVDLAAARDAEVPF